MKITPILLACASLGLGSFGVSNVQAGDWSVGVSIVAGDPHGRVWVEPVYDVRTEQVYVEAVYETRVERVWHEPIVETRYQRVWVPDRFENRVIRCVDYAGRIVFRTETVLAEPGHFADQQVPVVVREGWWETVERRVCVREGGWQMVQQRVCVREGYWMYAPVRHSRSELDVRVDAGRVSVGRARNDDADHYRESRERNRDQQDDRERYDRSQSRDRGERYR